MAELKSDVLEDLEEVQLSLNHPEWVVKIGTRMELQIRVALIDFLKNHLDMFAWLIDDMVGSTLR